MADGSVKLHLSDQVAEDVVSEALRHIDRRCSEHPVTTDCGDEPLLIRVDARLIVQVLVNLVNNAIKYTPRGGRVHVELAKQGKTAVVRVADNGIGIPEEDQLHIFDRFYRVDKARSRETGGTGLGLSIVKQIVLLHDGNISVSSRENEGSTFTVELPLLQKTTGGKAHE